MSQVTTEQHAEESDEPERRHRFECLLNDQEQSDLTRLKRRMRWTKSQVVREGIRLLAHQQGLTPES